MIELNKPTAIAATEATGPAPWLTNRHKTALTAANSASKRDTRTRINSQLPTKRPTIAQNQ